MRIIRESKHNITRARSEQQTAQTKRTKIYKTTKYGPIAQLGERTVRIHMQSHPTALVPFQFSSPISLTYPSKLNISKTRFS